MLSTKGEMIGHIPETLAKILSFEMAKEAILSLETESAESQTDAPEEKWVLRGGIEIPCTYKVYGKIDQKSYLHKSKGTK